VSERCEHPPEGEVQKLAQAAGEGNRHALEVVVRWVCNDIYRLALRMTGNVPDAEEATQEVLIKLITRLGSYHGESSLRTWAYRVAMKHLLDRSQGRVESLQLNFEAFARHLLDGLDSEANGEQAMLAHEVRLGCTLAMLTCLDRSERAAYILMEIFDLPEDTAAELLDIKVVALRQRRARAKRKIEGFTKSYCGLVNPSAPCRCDRRVSRAVELGRMSRENLALTNHPRSDAEGYVQHKEYLRDTAKLLRNHPPYAVPEVILNTILGSLLFARSDKGD
jgi:RNA polymerase sigma factor (sigma-70 family)